MQFVRKHLSRAILAIPLIFLSVVAIYPFIYMVLLSFTSARSMVLRFSDLTLDFRNYISIYVNFDFFRYMINSTIVAGGGVFANILIASMAAYGFVKKVMPGRKLLFNIVLISMMVPGQVTIVTVFLMMLNIGILDTYLSLFLPHVGAFGVFLVSQFMHGVPDELLEAAKIDGCGEARTYFSIVLPLIRTVLVSLAIFIFIATWNDLIWPLITISDRSMRTLVLALSILSGNYATNYGLVMAGATLTFLPPFLLYVFLQKRFVEGIALSGIKG